VYSVRQPIGINAHVVNKTKLKYLQGGMRLRKQCSNTISRKP